VGGFSTPGSNTRTAHLPNPHPVGLQSRCSVLQGPLSLGLCQPQPRARHTHGGIPAPKPHWLPAIRTHTTLEYTPLGHTATSMTIGIPATRTHWTPARTQFPGLAGIPPNRAHCPSDPAEPQLHVG
jgi:hypothetical protein